MPTRWAPRPANQQPLAAPRPRRWRWIFLVAQGVPAGRLKAEGKGEADPVASNATDAGRQLNRRVEILVSPSSSPQPEPQSGPAPTS